jgi:hypothetical protein
MPMVPRDERERYRSWAKDNHREQMDEHAWVHENAWQSFLLRDEKQRAERAGN